MSADRRPSAPPMQAGALGAAPEIEITPEMETAGVLALNAHENDPTWATPEERVAAVFRAMIKARQQAG
jgi:hypothetical protein